MTQAWTPWDKMFSWGTPLRWRPVDEEYLSTLLYELLNDWSPGVIFLEFPSAWMEVEL